MLNIIMYRELKRNYVDIKAKKDCWIWWYRVVRLRDLLGFCAQQVDNGTLTIALSVLRTLLSWNIDQ